MPIEQLEPVVSWAGCIFGLLGSWLLSNNDRMSGWGFASYLVSNVGWMAFAILTANIPMALMQLGFTWTSLRGLRRWGVLSFAPTTSNDFQDPGLHPEVRESR